MDDPWTVWGSSGRSPCGIPSGSPGDAHRGSFGRFPGGSPGESFRTSSRGSSRLATPMGNPVGNGPGDVLGNPMGNPVGDALRDPQGDPQEGGLGGFPKGISVIRGRSQTDPPRVPQGMPSVPQVGKPAANRTELMSPHDDDDDDDGRHSCFFYRRCYLQVCTADPWANVATRPAAHISKPDGACRWRRRSPAAALEGSSLI